MPKLLSICIVSLYGYTEPLGITSILFRALSEK